MAATNVNALLMLLLMVVFTLMALMAVTPAEAGCTVKNNSGKSVVIVPTIDVSVSITVEAGASVELPQSQQSCYFKNGESGHELGPFSLTDGTVVACVDGLVSGTIDVYATSQPLLSSVLSLLTCLPTVTVCLSL